MMSDNNSLVFRKVWWLNPSYIVAVFLIPIYLLLWVAGVYTDGAVSSAKSIYFFHGEYAFLGLLSLLFMYIGTLSPIRYKKRSSDKARNTILILNTNILTLLGYISIIGYIYWFKDIILNPGLLISQIQNSAYISVRGTIERSAGIASFAQLGLVYLMFFIYQSLLDKSKLTKIHYLLLYAIIIFIVLRVFLWSERLALIEAMVAIIFIWVSYGSIKRAFLEKLLPFFPLIGGTVVLLFFGLGEFFRSWSSFYVNQSLGFWEFIFQRLVNYYFEALNTGTGMLTTQAWPTYDFSYILAWLHKLPFIGNLFSFSIGAESGLTSYYLNRYGDPEFNSPSGVFAVFLDIGIGAGLLFFFLIGVTSRYFYSLLENAVYFYGLFYYLFLMLFFELFRYLYIGESRTFMVVLGFLLFTLAQKRTESSA